MLLCVLCNRWMLTRITPTPGTIWFAFLSSMVVSSTIYVQASGSEMVARISERTTAKRESLRTDISIHCCVLKTLSMQVSYDGQFSYSYQLSVFWRPIKTCASKALWMAVDINGWGSRSTLWATTSALLCSALTCSIRMVGIRMTVWQKIKNEGGNWLSG